MDNVLSPWSLALGGMIFLVFICQEYLTGKFMNSIGSKYALHARKHFLFNAIRVGLILLCYVLHFPPTYLYIVSFLVYSFDYRKIVEYSYVQFWFWTHMRFLHFSALHMICLAAVALYNKMTLRDTYDTAQLWMLTMFLTVCLLFCVFELQRRVISVETMRLLFGDVKRLKRLIAFEWFAIGYVLFDAYTMISDLPYALMAWLLIGSSGLLLLQLYLFLLHTLRVILNAHYETEYYRLEAERAEHVKTEMRLRSLAYTDDLTGVYSRRYAISLLESMLRDAESLSLAYIDLNGLKKVNDSEGHLAGDRYLILAARYLNEYLRAEDTLARVGGDEFLVIAPKADRLRLETLLETANQRLRAERIAQFELSFCFGVTEIAVGTQVSAEELLRRSDALMYVQKKKLVCATGGAR